MDRISWGVLWSHGHLRVKRDFPETCAHVGAARNLMLITSIPAHVPKMAIQERRQIIPNIHRRVQAGGKRSSVCLRLTAPRKPPTASPHGPQSPGQDEATGAAP